MHGVASSELRTKHVRYTICRTKIETFDTLSNARGSLAGNLAAAGPSACARYPCPVPLMYPYVQLWNKTYVKWTSCFFLFFFSRRPSATKAVALIPGKLSKHNTSAFSAWENNDSVCDSFWLPFLLKKILCRVSLCRFYVLVVYSDR